MPAPSHPERTAWGCHCTSQDVGWILKSSLWLQGHPLQSQAALGDAAPSDLARWGRVRALALAALQLWWVKRKDRSIMVWVFKHLQGLLLWAKEMFGGAFCFIKRKMWNPMREKQSLLWDKMLAGKSYFFFFAFISESQWTTLKTLICDRSLGPCRDI